MATFFALCTGCAKAGKQRKIKAACEIPKATSLPAAGTCAYPRPRPELAPTRRPRPKLARISRLPSAYPRQPRADFAPSLPADPDRNPRRFRAEPARARSRNSRGFRAYPRPRPKPAPISRRACPRPPKTTSAASPFGKSSALKLTTYLLLCLATMAFIISIFCSISATSFSWVRARSRL